MFHNIGAHKLDKSFLKRLPKGNDVYVSVKAREILAKEENDSLILPSYSEVGFIESTYLFSVDDISFFMINKEIEGYKFLTLTNNKRVEPAYLSYPLQEAVRLVKWYQKNKYCGNCGSLTVSKEDERALVCPNCGNTIYPRINPVAIVGVIKDNTILLTKYSDPNRYDRYALIAGFSEFGETIEETVIREVKEEVGLDVKNVHYFGSSPWPMSESLIFGFYCELDGEDKIEFTDGELKEAKWFTSEELSEAPHFSITGELMNNFKQFGRKVLDMRCEEYKL